MDARRGIGRRLLSPRIAAMHLFAGGVVPQRIGARVRQSKGRAKVSSSVPGVLTRAWKHREPVLWAAVIALVLTVQWPMLKGWYYRETGAAAPASGIAWRKGVRLALEIGTEDAVEQHREHDEGNGHVAGVSLSGKHGQ
jgi:hypothetical protein